MPPLRFAIERLESVLGEIERLKDADFPYGHSKDGLDHIEQVFRARLSSLKQLSTMNSSAVIHTACTESLLQVAVHLPLLGFILRSTNVRNSFEIFGPLLRLARQVLGPDIRLIVSSEWEYSPHVYRPIAGLPDFVLLGLPASESSNPLLVPLAGHELGHTTWQRRGLANAFEALVTNSIKSNVRAQEQKYKDLFGGDLNDLFMTQNLAPAHSWALRQAEESFCDFLGLRIFGESYLLAFAYLATPGGRHRSVHYPNMDDRVGNLLLAAQKYAVSAPSDFPDWFSSEIDWASNEKEKFLLELADAARSSIVQGLLEKADEIASAANVPVRNEESMQRVIDSLGLMTPAEGVGDLVNILNAGWRAYHDPELWKGIPIDRIATLNELVLKSIEILEFEERLKTG